MTKTQSSWKAKALITLLWANFVFLWTRVYWITTPGDVEDSFSHLGGLILAYGVIVTLWIYHNVRIYRKKGPRKHVRPVLLQDASDALKRDIVRYTDVKAEQEIVVDIISGQKVFHHHLHETHAQERRSEKPHSGKPQEEASLTSI